MPLSIARLSAYDLIIPNCSMTSHDAILLTTDAGNNFTKSYLETDCEFAAACGWHTFKKREDNFPYARAIAHNFASMNPVVLGKFVAAFRAGYQQEVTKNQEKVMKILVEAVDKELKKLGTRRN